MPLGIGNLHIILVSFEITKYRSWFTSLPMSCADCKAQIPSSRIPDISHLNLASTPPKSSTTISSNKRARWRVAVSVNGLVPREGVEQTTHFSVNYYLS